MSLGSLSNPLDTQLFLSPQRFQIFQMVTQIDVIMVMIKPCNPIRWEQASWSSRTSKELAQLLDTHGSQTHAHVFRRPIYTSTRPTRCLAQPHVHTRPGANWLMRSPKSHIQATHTANLYVRSQPSRSTSCSHSKPAQSSTSHKKRAHVCSPTHVVQFTLVLSKYILKLFPMLLLTLFLKNVLLSQN